LIIDYTTSVCDILLKMNQSIAILGRQPALGIAELERLYGAEALQVILPGVALLQQDPNAVAFDRLGGTVKLAKLLTKLEFTDWRQLTEYLVEHVPKHTCCYGPGKLILGISTYGLKVDKKAIERTALSVKKAVVATDRPVRVVPTNGTELSSAQVLHNHMTKPPLGMELLIIRDGNGLLLAQTNHVQNIDAYAARDQARPKRDAKVGMLPPKLAQIIINLAIGPRDPSHEEIHLMDPFCGTGVLLQEALLMGLFVMGSDKDPRMIEYATKNIEWLGKTTGYKGDLLSLEVADATTHSWVSTFDTIACETYLGQPFTHLPDPDKLQQVIHDVNHIHKTFLRHLAQHQNVITARKYGHDFVMCLAVPAWRQKQGFKHLPVLDQLESLGYTRVSFVHAKRDDLVYHREGQIVARELVVLKRK
jgi:2-polyprenyl-3-methyl-5-hydroxy-6-metoxy-1,4-benzoquinol methylase